MPVSSADFKFVFDAGMSDTVDVIWEDVASRIAEVNIVDDKTFEVVFKELNCAALADLQQAIQVLPAHKYAADFSDFESGDFNLNPDISAGPYILEEWAVDEYQSFRSNPDFYLGEPAIPFVINRVIGEQALANQALQAGEIDYTNMMGDLFDQVANKDNLQWEAFPQKSVNFLSLNWADPNDPQPMYDEEGNLTNQPGHPLFSDINVRKAVAMGWNKEDVIGTLGEYGGVLLGGPVPPAFAWAVNTDLELYPYDPDAAMALLDEAGWTDGDGDGIRECNGCATAEEGTPLAFTISFNPIVQYFETETLVIQDQLGQIGFDVSAEFVEWSNYIPEVYLGQVYDATPMSNSTAGDPNDFMSLINSRQDIPGAGNNLASYGNPQVDELIDQALSVPGCGQEERAAIYREIQQITHDDVAYDWAFLANFIHVANQRVGNFNPGPSWVFYGYLDDIHNWTLEG